MPHASHAETHRHEHGESCAHNHSERVSSHEHSHNHADACCSAAPVALAKLSGPETIGANVRTAIRIMQMDCPTEEALIRKKLGRMPYVRSLDFNQLDVWRVRHRDMVHVERWSGMDPRKYFRRGMGWLFCVYARRGSCDARNVLPLPCPEQYWHGSGLQDN